MDKTLFIQLRKVYRKFYLFSTKYSYLSPNYSKSNMSKNYFVFILPLFLFSFSWKYREAINSVVKISITQSEKRILLKCQTETEYQNGGYQINYKKKTTKYKQSYHIEFLDILIPKKANRMIDVARLTIDFGKIPDGDYMLYFKTHKENSVVEDSVKLVIGSGGTALLMYSEKGVEMTE